MGHFTSCGCSIQYTTVQKASGQLCSEKSHDSRNKMQDHCNGHRCHGDRFSLYEKCSHRQDLHCSGVGLPSSVFHLAGQDHQAHRADSGKCRIDPTRDTIRLQASMARRDTVTFLSIHEIQRQHEQQHVYRVKGVAGILEWFAVAALPPAIQPDGHQRQ